MKALVTGATGFVGSHLVHELLSRGYEVRVLARDFQKAEKFNKYNIDIVYGDLKDESSLVTATKEIEIVYHLAALLGGPGICEGDLYEVNVEGTRRLLDASISNGVKKFLYLSGGAVIGDVTYGANENSTCNPSTPYARTKYDGEQLVLKYMKDFGISSTIVRSTMVYGPGEVRYKLKMMKMIKRGLFRIIGDGKNQTSWVYIDNLVDGLLLASMSDKAIGEIYIISDERPYTMNEFVEAASEALGVKTPGHIPNGLALIAAVAFEGLSKISKIDPPLFRDRIVSLTANHSCDCSKARKELGYNPKITLREGLKRTVNYYRDNNLI